MDAEKEVKKLIKNINVGVSKLTLEKFNKIVSNALAKHSEKGEYEISESLKIVAKFYSLPEDVLMTKARGKVYTAKMVLFKILNHTLGISAQRIAKYFKRYPNSITHALQRFEKLNPEKKPRDKKVYEDYLEIKKRIQLFINEENA
jgi:hypothetical protein